MRHGIGRGACVRTTDQVIPYAHGKELFELAAEPKSFVTVEGGNHNDFVRVMDPWEYLARIKLFMESL